MKDFTATHHKEWDGNLLHMAILEIIGREGVADLMRLNCTESSILNKNWAGPPGDSIAEFDHLQETLEKIYDIEAGRGLSAQIGRTIFRNCLRESDLETGITSHSYRLLPYLMRMEKGLEIFATLFTRITHHPVKVEIGDKTIAWQILPKFPVGNHDVSLVCMLAIGFLQEALYWMSSGRNFIVGETDCLGSGASWCTININRKPMG